MGHSKFGNLTRHATATARGGERARCITCQRPIVWGERCEGCKRELRQRQRRKPR
jgi:hypothetical protein